LFHAFHCGTSILICLGRSSYLTKSGGLTAPFLEA
jgi:hypothetical protein